MDTALPIHRDSTREKGARSQLRFMEPGRGRREGLQQQLQPLEGMEATLPSTLYKNR